MLLAFGLVDQRPRICVSLKRRTPALYVSFRDGWAELARQGDHHTRLGDPDRNPVSFKKAVRTLRAFDGIVEIASESEMADA